jgi:hypothetical protein
VTLNVNGKLLAEWNLANEKARQAYRLQQGIQSLPGGLNHRTEGLRGRPIRGWLLDLLADSELAEAKAAAAQHMADVAMKELGLALLKIERLTGGKVKDEAEVRDLRQQDQDDGVQKHWGMFWGM